jgi:Flp pilus assembly protein TadG
MAFSGLKWVKHLRRHAARLIGGSSVARLGRDRSSAAAVEFAVVGSLYLLLLLFVIEGGLFYLKIAVLDYATEAASRAILLNGNANAPTPPTTTAQFQTKVAANSFGLLNVTNIVASVQLNDPDGGTYDGGNANAGFQNITPYKFANGAAPPFQYIYGTCTNVAYQKIVATTGTPATLVSQGSDIQSSGTCTGNPVCVASTAATPNNRVIGGTVDGGVISGTTTTTIGGTVFTFTNYKGGTFTCSIRTSRLPTLYRSSLAQ